MPAMQQGLSTLSGFRAAAAVLTARGFPITDVALRDRARAASVNVAVMYNLPPQGMAFTMMGFAATIDRSIRYSASIDSFPADGNSRAANAASRSALKQKLVRLLVNTRRPFMAFVEVDSKGVESRLRVLDAAGRKTVAYAGGFALDVNSPADAGWVVVNGYDPRSDTFAVVDDYGTPTRWRSDYLLDVMLYEGTIAGTKAVRYVY